MFETTLKISSRKQMQMIDITALIEGAIRQSSIESGYVFLHNLHTTAGLTINEGADPDVQTDIIAGLQSMVPDLVYHHLEGNSPSHIMASLMGSSLQLAISDSRLILGTWQRVFFCDFDGPRSRSVFCRITKSS